MNLHTFLPRCVWAIVAMMLYSNIANAGTVVRFNSLLGSFDVRMYDESTPLTVANILQYVNDGDFDDSIVHRVENRFQQLADGSFVNQPFVIQGGNFAIPAGGLITEIPNNPNVTNEPGLSNLRGTIALARIGGQINSGTNNWFVNTKDNAFLDTVDEGFTVFGRVVNDGMVIVDSISNLPTQTILNQFGQSLGSTFPIHGDLSNGLTRENFVLFTSVEELDIPDGDHDFDGDVDGTDFLSWQRGFGSTVDVAADNNGDAIVDGDDLLFWQTNFGVSSVALTLNSVPEPSTFALMALGILPFLGRRR